MTNELDRQGERFDVMLAGMSEQELEAVTEMAKSLPSRPSSLSEAQRARPLSTQEAYSSAKYEREKISGRRRSNGTLKLKRLTARHMDIISMHLRGMSGEEIATKLNCTVITVSRVLNDPLARNLISQVYTDRQGEIDALAGQAIGAVRDVLCGDAPATKKLTAVDKFVKLKDSIGKDAETAKTAEDVVARIFAGLNISGDNVQVNVIGEHDGR